MVELTHGFPDAWTDDDISHATMIEKIKHSRFKNKHNLSFKSKRNDVTYLFASERLLS
jgi:hypothetical protein